MTHDLGRAFCHWGLACGGLAWIMAAALVHTRIILGMTLCAYALLAASLIIRGMRLRAKYKAAMHLLRRLWQLSKKQKVIVAMVCCMLLGGTMQHGGSSGKYCPELMERKKRKKPTRAQRRAAGRATKKLRVKNQEARPPGG